MNVSSLLNCSKARKHKTTLSKVREVNINLPNDKNMKLITKTNE